MSFKDYDREYIVSEEVIIKDTDTKAKIEKTIIISGRRRHRDNFI